MKKGVVLFFSLFLFFISFASSLDTTKCPLGMIGYWKFDGNVLDSFGTNNGINTGGEFEENFKVGQALKLGEGKYVTIPDKLNLRPSSKMSIEFWVKNDGVLPSDLITKTGYSVDISLTSIDAVFKSGASSYVTLTGNIDTNAHFIVITWDKEDAGGTAKLYIDKVLADSDTLTGIDYTGSEEINPLVIGGNFIGLIDEFAIYNTVLTQTDVNAHYDNTVKGLNYCEAVVGVLSGTQKKFSLLGCDIPGINANLPVGTCISGSPYNGYYYCESFGNLKETLNDANACVKTGELGNNCCPINYVCEIREIADGGVDDTNSYCYQRETNCESYTSESQCSENECNWVDGKCFDPNDKSVGCEVYKSETTCKEDTWNRGQIGAGTDVCGTFTSNGKVIPKDSCKCTWGGESDKNCYFDYTVIDEIYNPNGVADFFNCLKQFDSTECVEGKQTISWTAKTVPANAPGAESAGCVSGVVENNCGGSLIALPFFTFTNFIVSGLVIGIFYLVLRRR